MSTPRLLLADDHAVEMRCALLRPAFEVIAQVGDSLEFLAAADLAPEVIVSDIAVPGLDGFAAAAMIVRRNPTARIGFITVLSDHLG